MTTPLESYLRTRGLARQIQTMGGNSIPADVLRHLQQGIENDVGRALAAAAARDWSGVMSSIGSEHRPGLARTIWPLLRPEEKPAVLADAIGSGDALVQERDWLVRILRGLLRSGRRVFDSPQAEAAFNALPDRVTVHRGCVLAEANSGKLGVSWTLDFERAKWFAAEHGRFRNTESMAVVVTAEVDRSQIAGHLTKRVEAEVLMLPGVDWWIAWKEGNDK